MNNKKIKTFRTSQINDPTIPQSPGIYSWYIDLTLPKKDTVDIIKYLNYENDEIKRRNVLEDFLENKLFYPFHETSYHVILQGKLKPMYSGSLIHQQYLSESFIKSVIEQPERLLDLQKLLSEISIEFLSPIYIGMASKLRKRLKSHIDKMNQYYDNAPDGPIDLKLIDENSVDITHIFALDVAYVRKINPEKLFFTFYEIEFDNKIENDLENILNRLNYPLCGRN